MVHIYDHFDVDIYVKMVVSDVYVNFVVRVNVNPLIIARMSDNLIRGAALILSTTRVRPA